MEQPKRKPNRLKNYDYSSNGAYFITICIKDKREILWKDVGATCCRPQMQLSDIGLIVDSEINLISDVYENVLIDKYVIMPNHIHMIILLRCGKNGRAKLAPTISRVIQQFKGSLTKKIGYSVWQKLYHDHVIRDEQGYRTIWEYIDTNPLTWENDCFYTKRNIE